MGEYAERGGLRSYLHPLGGSGPNSGPGYTTRKRRTRPTETPTLHEGGRPRGRRARPSIQAKGVCGFQEEVGGEKAMLREAYLQLKANRSKDVWDISPN